MSESSSSLPSRLTDRKRDAILQAAIDEFLKHGFTGTSMDQVAAEADVSKRTVYNHFPSKDQLFAAILEQLWERSQGVIGITYSARRSLRAQLLELLERKMTLLNDASFMNLVRVAMAEMMYAPERVREMVARLSQKEEDLAGWIRAAQSDGRLRRGFDAVLAANQLQGMVKALAFWPQLAMGQPPLSAALQQQVVSDAVDMFLGFYGNAKESGKA